MQDPQTGVVHSRRPKDQITMPMCLEPVAAEARDAAEALRKRRTETIGKIRKAGRSAFIAGTRVPTSVIWSLHQDNLTDKQIAKHYPALELRDIEAALVFERRRTTKRTA